MLLLEKFGKITEGRFFAIPYQHHSHKITWNVFVGKGDNNEYLNVIADEAKEAAKLAISCFRQKMEDLQKMKEMEDLPKLKEIE